MDEVIKTIPKIMMLKSPTAIFFDRNTLNLDMGRVRAIFNVLLPCSPANRSAEPQVVLDGKTTSFDVPPLIENGRTLVPFRTIFEALGTTVNWDDTTRTVTANKENTEIKLTIGGQAYRNGLPVTLDVPATIINDRTMVPLSFVSESLGCQVVWANATQTITITSAGTNINKANGTSL